MKKFISLFLALSIVSNVACVHTQTTTPTTQVPENTQNSVISTDASADSFTVELPPLPAPQSLPQIITDGGAGPNGEVIASLRADARAPFNGVLFNGPALAYVEVEYRAVQQRCMIDRRRETEEVVARYQAQLERLQVSLDTTIAQHRIVVQGRDREIAGLNRVIEQQRDAATITPLQVGLYIGGGILIGALITGTTAYVITR
jgi:hypothetical protein